MRDPKPPELHAERPVRSDFARGGSYGHAGLSHRTKQLLTVSVLAGLFSVALYGIVRYMDRAAPEETPTLSADMNYKQKPDQPGGLVIPGQDMKVYDKLSSTAQSNPTVEHLLPPPETPKPMPAPNAASEKDIAPAPVAAPVPPAPVASSVAAAPTPQTLKPPAAAPVHTVEKPAENPVEKASAVIEKTHATIQLASVSNEKAARADLQKLQARYAAVLGTTSLRLVRADLADKKTVWRIQTAPLPESKATRICERLKQQKAGCLLVHR